MKNEKRNLAWIIFIGLAIVWGSSFILMKRGLESFHFYEVGSFRLAFAFWFTALIGFRYFKKFKAKDAWPLFVVGILGNGLPYMLFPIALSEIDSSIIGVINSLVPLFTLIIGMVFFKSGVKKLQVLGIIVGFIGAYVLINPHGAHLGEKWYFVFFAIAASLCYALSINTISKKLAHLDSLSITLLSLMFVGIPATSYLLISGSIMKVVGDPVAQVNLGYIAILGILGTSIAVILFNYLIKISSPIFSASVTYFIPIIAIAWGWFDGEQIGVTTVAGVILILFGVYLVNFKRKAKEESVEVIDS
ncbi:MAG: DMT family transporter [Schleiferiaceae bacterium]|jgi:drug/metabolite transporter (DMT)-like permease|nr:DMT family transporter [Schleiferiaceae bacterium]